LQSVLAEQALPASAKGISHTDLLRVPKLRSVPPWAVQDARSVFSDGDWGMIAPVATATVMPAAKAMPAFHVMETA